MRRGFGGCGASGRRGSRGGAAGTSPRLRPASTWKNFVSGRSTLWRSGGLLGAEFARSAARTVAHGALKKKNASSVELAFPNPAGS
jgi:hypothetical protein